jgi:hypothetical protein
MVTNARGETVDTDTGEVLYDVDEPDLESVGEVDPLAYNRHLLQAARDMQIRGIGPYVADEKWPINKIVEANVALEVKITERAQEGDAEVASRQERILA